MANITKLDRNTVKTLRAEIDNALEAVLSKHGLTAELGRITFTDTDFRGKLTISCGSADDAAERDFKKYAFRFGLTGNEFGKTFKHGRTSFTISGIKPKSHKYPILAKNANGTEYKFPAHYAREAV